MTTTLKTTTKSSSQMILTALTLSLGALPALGFVAVGCTDETEEVAAVSTRSDALGETGDDGQLHREHRASGRHDRKEGAHKMRGHRGKRQRDPGRMLIQGALRQDSLTAAQRQTVEALATANSAERKSNRHASRAEFRATWAQAVRSGNVDAEAVKAHFEKRAAVREARRAAHAEALNTLYATLTPEQRAAVVSDIKAGFAKRDAARDGRQHRRGDKRGFEKSERGIRMSKRGRDGRHGKGGFGLLKGLDLTETQQQQLAALRPNRKGRFSDKTARTADRTERRAMRQAMKQCRTAHLESFAGESFDPAARCTARSDEDRSAKMTQRLEGFQKMLAILTEAQRNQLADRMENPPALRRNAPRRNAPRI